MNFMQQGSEGKLCEHDMPSKTHEKSSSDQKSMESVQGSMKDDVMISPVESSSDKNFMGRTDCG